MLGKRKEPVFFKIYKSVMGIARSRYQTGVLETRDNREIAMLRRLPPNHVKETGVEVAKKRLAPEKLYGDTDLRELPWFEIQRRMREHGLYRVGMTRVSCEITLRALEAPAMRVQMA